MTEGSRTDKGAESEGGELGPVEAITAAVRLGAGPMYGSGAMDIGDEEVQRVRLAPAPMPQYQIAYDSGVDPVFPEGLEEEYPGLVDQDSVASQTRRQVQELAEKAEQEKGESGGRGDGERGAGAGTAAGGGSGATGEEQGETPTPRRGRPPRTAAT